MISNENVLIPQKRKSIRLSLLYQSWRIQVCEFVVLIVMAHYIRRFFGFERLLSQFFDFE